MLRGGPRCSWLLQDPGVRNCKFGCGQCRMGLRYHDACNIDTVKFISNSNQIHSHARFLHQKALLNQYRSSYHFSTAGRTSISHVNAVRGCVCNHQ